MAEINGNDQWFGASNKKYAENGNVESQRKIGKLDGTNRKDVILFYQMVM